MQVTCLCSRTFQADKIGHFGTCPHCNRLVLVRWEGKKGSGAVAVGIEATNLGTGEKHIRRFEK